MPKLTNTEFTVIGICETHSKDKSSDMYNLNRYNIEYTNRLSRDKGDESLVFVCVFLTKSILWPNA